MMARLIIQATLALLLTIVYIHNCKGSGGVQADQMTELKTTQERNIPSGPLQSKWRISREAGRKDANRRKKKKTSNKKSKKEGKTKKSRRINGQSKKIRKARKKKGKSRTNKNKSRKNKNKSRKNRKMKRQRKKETKKTKGRSKKAKKVVRKGTRKSSEQKTKANEISRQKARQACDENALGQKLKDYIKISNQLRKVRRIIKACDTMEKKANKSLTSFEATVAALDSSRSSSSKRRMYMSRSRWKRSNSSDEECTKIKEQLKNCSKTASAKCKKSSVAACQNETLLTTCETKLQDWINKYGPVAGSCLKAPDKYCSCITALPDVPKECVAFDKKNTLALSSKKKCTSGDEEGSFGFCKKLIEKVAEIKPGCGKSPVQTVECLDEGLVQGSITTRRPPTGTRQTRTSLCACWSQDCILWPSTVLSEIPTFTLEKEFYISFYFFANQYFPTWQNIIELTYGCNCPGRGLVIPLVSIYSSNKIEICFPNVGSSGTVCQYTSTGFKINQWYKVTITQEQYQNTIFYPFKVRITGGSLTLSTVISNTATVKYTNVNVWGTNGGDPLYGKIANLQINPKEPRPPVPACA